MKIGIASDHRGYEIKKELIEYLEKNGNIVTDCGTYTTERVDYPEYAFKLCNKVKEDMDFGIAICGTGIGMSIACNKVKGIRCAKIDNINDAVYAKCHNNANIIAISANKEISEIKEMVSTFMKNTLSDDVSHQRRIDLITEYENDN